MRVDKNSPEVVESYDFSADEYYSEIETQWLQFYDIIESLINECCGSSARMSELPTLPKAMQLIAERRFDAYKMADRLKKEVKPQPKAEKADTMQPARLGKTYTRPPFSYDEEDQDA